MYAALYPAAVETAAAIPLQPEDRAILALESDTVAGHACKVVVLGAPAPPLGRLRASIAGRLGAAPELTRRLGEAGGAPAWVPDERFDIDAHVVPFAGAPLDAAGLRAEVARLFAQRLDRSRPLWRIDVAPLRGGGAALVWRTHHALADGSTALAEARALLWDDPGPPPAPAHRVEAARRREGLLGVLRREVAGPGDASPFDGEVGTRREVAFGSLPLRPLHDAARAACGATVNDALLCCVAGGVRRWLEARHGRLGELRLRVPVSLHHQGDGAANRDSFFSMDVSLSEPDPLARLRDVRDATAARKAARDAEALELLGADLGRLSPALRRLAARVEASPRAFAVAVSNVPGPRGPVAVLGSPVRALHTLAEIGRHHALRVSAVSLAGALDLGMLADPGLVEGLDTLADGAVAEAHALIAAA